MSKDIQVLKFAVRRDKVRYGPGLPAGVILYGLPDQEADRLIAESNGTIVELPKREEVEAKVAEQKVSIEKKTASSAKSGKKNEPAGLGDIDPNSTVK